LKKAIILILIGILVLLSGIIFHLQGQAMVGPEQSFMYANSEWVSHGLKIIILGASTIIVGIVLSIKKG